MSVHKVVDVIAMWHGRVTAVRSVHMIRIMSFAVMRHAAIRIYVGHVNSVFVVVVFVSTVQVPVVQVSHVVAVLNGDVAAARAVLVIVVLMDFVRHGLVLQGSGVKVRVRVGVFKDVSDKRFHVGIRQPIEHVPAVTPPGDQVLVQKNP